MITASVSEPQILVDKTPGLIGPAVGVAWSPVSTRSAVLRGAESQEDMASLKKKKKKKYSGMSHTCCTCVSYMLHVCDTRKEKMAKDIS